MIMFNTQIGYTLQDLVKEVSLPWFLTSCRKMSQVGLPIRPIMPSVLTEGITRNYRSFSLSRNKKIKSKSFNEKSENLIC